MTSEDPKQGEDATTVRAVLDMLLGIAADLPEGLDSRMEIGICDGENLQLIDHVDADVYTETTTTATAEAAGRLFVILRGHHHPGEIPGMLLRGVASAADSELRKPTGDESR